MGVAQEDSRPAVVVVTHNYPRTVEDQAGQFIQTLLVPVADRYRFVVVAPHEAGLAESEVVRGIEVERFRYGPDARETLAYEGNMHEQVLGSWSKRILFLAFLRAMRQRVRSVVASTRPVAAHVHWWIPGALAAAGTLSRGGVPYVLTTHGSDVTLLDRFGAVRPLGRRLFRRAAACTAVSTYLQERLESLTGVRADVLPMPYDDRKFVPEPPAAGAPPVITCVGRLIERKGQRFLLEAVARLVQQDVPCRVQFVGDGPDRSLLEQLAGRLGIADRVVWTGNVPHEKVPRIFRDSAVVVLPSIRDWKGEVEGLGMVLVEASACGRPVVGTRLAGIRDAVEDERSGLLVEPEDPAGLARALQRILEDSELARRLGTGGIEFARSNFSPAGQAGKLSRIIERVRR